MRLMNSTSISCRSGRLRSIAARIAAGVAVVTPTAVGTVRLRRIVIALHGTGHRRRRTPRQRPTGTDERGARRAVRADERRGHAAASRTAGALEQQTEHLAVVDARRFAERRWLRRRPRRRIGAVVEQQLQRVRGSDDAAGHDEGGSRGVRARVDVGAGVEQQLHLAAIGRSPHQGCRARRVSGIGVGAKSEETFHQCGIAVQRRRHQGRCRVGSTLADGLRRVAQHAVDGRLVALTNGAHQHRRVRVRGGRGDFPGQLVGPFRALIDPFLDGLDLRVFQRAGRRHPLPELGVDQSVIEPASVGVTRPDVRLRPAAQGVGAAIEPQPVHLQFGAVTAHTVLLQDRLHVTSEIGLARRWLRRQQDRCRRNRCNDHRG